MKINLFRVHAQEPEVYDIADSQTVGQAIERVGDPEFSAAILDSSGIRRFVSVYLGVPGAGVRNVKLEQGMETAIKKGENLTILIADPFTS